MGDLKSEIDRNKEEITESGRNEITSGRQDCVVGKMAMELVRYQYIIFVDVCEVIRLLASAHRKELSIGVNF